ncbi:TetR/AcrR family transcriptional regulator C-terminal domain-containing protein [Cryptosporangium japonicum]|uniref:TetR/AcrR family transcriptional regulator C-terminal domain-containing protein n=1 Tax=Cryptosporangium japonicum TaxID=80872 RepID=A0ABP3DQ64_9ACTN
MDSGSPDRRAEIVRAALDLLDESGLDAVTLRAVAARIGVRLNTVSWHVKTKAGLRDLLADAVVGEIRLDRLPSAGGERARELLRRYRRTLLAHRDGGRVVAGTFPAEPGTFAFGEALAAAILDAGFDERAAGWTCWTLIYFTLGLVQEEQQSPDEHLAVKLDVGGHPALTRIRPYLAANDFDERFEFGLERILAR